MELNELDKLRRTEARQTASFNAWLAKPEIKMLVSLLPALETDTHRDCFAAVLRAAFTTGWNGGEGAMAASMLEDLFAAKEQQERRGRT